MVGLAELFPQEKTFSFKTLRKKMLSFTFNYTRETGQWRSPQDNLLTKSTYHVGSACFEDTVNTPPFQESASEQSVRITRVATTEHNDPKASWIELKNTTDSPVNISGWRLVDSHERTRVISQLVLDPNQSIKIHNICPLELTRGIRLYTKNSKVMDDVIFKCKENNDQLALIHMNL